MRAIQGLVLVLVLVLATTLAACGASSGSGPEILPGTEVLYDGTAGEGGGSILDATRDGQRVAVLIDNEGSGMTARLTLMLSDNLGATWARHDLPNPASMGVNQINVNDLSLNPTMVHLYQGQVFLIIATVQSGGNSLYPKFAIAKVEPSANTYTLVGDVLGRQAFAIGATVGTYSVYGNAQNTTYYDAAFDQYNVTTDMNVTTIVNLPGACQRPYFTGDGLTYEAYCDVCRAHAMPASGMIPISNCAAPGSLVADTETQLYKTGRGVMAFYTAQGHAFATTLSEDSPAVFATPIDLGPGRIPEVGHDNTEDSAWTMRGNHQRYGGLISLPTDTTGNAMRFVEIPESGDAVERVLPAAPCADPTNCGEPRGRRALTWSVRLEGNDFLDLYRVNASDSAEQVTIYVRRDVVAATPISR